MTTRVTPRTVQRMATDNLNASLGKMADLQEKLSSGKSLRRPSDSPIQTVEAMQYRSDIRRTEQFQRNANDGLNWLGIADTTLTGMLSTVGRVRELLIRGKNGSMGPTERANIASEVETLQQTLIGAANTRYLERPLFAGNSGSDNAYAADGTFVGSPSDEIERRIGPNMKVRVNLTGPEVFGTDGAGLNGNLLQVVGEIAASLRNGGDLDVAVQALDAHTVTIQNQLGAVGARYNQVEGMKVRAEDQQVTMKNGLAEVESIDLPKTIVDLQLQEIAYKSALSATSRVIQPSLLDFLR